MILKRRAEELPHMSSGNFLSISKGSPSSCHQALASIHLVTPLYSPRPQHLCRSSAPVTLSSPIESPYFSPQAAVLPFTFYSTSQQILLSSQPLMLRLKISPTFCKSSVFLKASQDLDFQHPSLVRKSTIQYHVSAH